MSGISIAATGFYHPSHYKTNEWFVNYYSRQGVEIGGLLNKLGQEKRYLIDNENENTLTMAISASENALKSANWLVDDLDYIIFTSQTPEFLIPSTALKIHNALGANERTLAYDMNANCAGLLIAMDQVAKIMMSDSTSRRALVVGGDYLGPHSTDNTLYHSCFSDSAVAVLLEKKESASSFMGAEFRTHTSVIDNSLFPGRGLSKIGEGMPSTGVRFTPFDDDICIEIACKSINELLEKHKLKSSDISHWFLSQFSLFNINKICQKLNLDEARAPFIGDQYGYTATNSPLVAFHLTQQAVKIERGEHLLFWSIGAGWQSSAVLVRY